MNLLLAYWHQFWADCDDDELHRRTRERTCSDIWACNTVRGINYRRKRIEELRANSRTLPVWSAVVSAVRSYRRTA